VARTKATTEQGAQFLRFFGPLLDALRELGGSGRPSEVTDQIARTMALSDAAQNAQLPSGGSRFKNEVAWARLYLVRDGYLDSSTRGVWSLTNKGRESRLTNQQAGEIFRRWVKIDQEARRKRQDKTPEEDPQAPDQAIAPSPPGDYKLELMELLRQLPPAGFERLCMRLLRESGFVEVVVTGRAGDGGIDGHGTLEVNPLVSFRVLFQCKRYVGSVTPAQVRDFRGAMQGRADKGIVLTTGTFTSEARREASRDGVPPIELVDGTKLLQMFESLELGLKPTKSYEIDQEFFRDFSV
jgi:restriction system protein